MAVGGGRTDPGRARRVGEGEPGGAFLGDQVERGADQRLTQIAMMIAATAIVVARFRPAHVRCFYMSWSAIGRSSGGAATVGELGFRAGDEFEEAGVAVLVLLARPQYCRADLRRVVNPLAPA